MARYALILRRACARFAIPLVFGTAACAGAAPDPAGTEPEPLELPAIAATPPLQVPDTLDEPRPIEAGQAPPPGPYAPGFDAVRYDIAIALPDAGQRVRGRTTARVALVEPRADTLALDLTGLAVAGVRVDGREASFRHDAGKLYVPVPAERTVGDTIAVEVTYAGEPDDGLIIGRNIHGERTAFVDNWPNRARFWFPSIDHPSDKATVAFRVEAPAGWRVIANGELIRAPATAPRPTAPTGAARVGAVDPTGPAAGEAGAARGSAPQRDVWRWATEIPIPTYTMVIGAAELAVGEVGPAACGLAPASPAECVDVDYWVFPQDSATAARVFRRADDVVTLYSELIAPFPYEKLSHVQSSTRFGGMENVSAIFYSEESISRGGDLDGLIAHETAHQWFGDAVTEADWHHLWLSEGFATYLAAVFFEHADGLERFRETMAGNRTRYLESDVVDRPIVDTTETNLFRLLNANNYPKGAWVLHMLRGIVGDETFYDGLRRYYREHRHGTALTGDLRRAMEQSSGRDLDWFFRQWVFEPGYPRFRIDWRWDDTAGEAEVEIAQVQASEWPVFRMPLTLEFVTPDGPVRRTVEVDARDETFRLPLPAAPSEVRLDPDEWVLKEVVG